MKCPACGFLNSGQVDVCELCGRKLGFVAEESDGPRVPSGGFAVVESSGTDVGYSADVAVASTFGASRPVSQITDLGERAAKAAASTHQTAAVGEEPSTVLLIGKLKLVVEQGMLIGEQYLLSQSVMIVGRADLDARQFPDIDLGGQDNDYVHRRHARLQFHDNGTSLCVEHIGGHNLTLVNNEAVESGELVELQPNDRLRVGRVVMRLLKVD